MNYEKLCFTLSCIIMEELIKAIEAARDIARELDRSYEVHRLDAILMDLYHNDNSWWQQL